MASVCSQRHILLAEDNPSDVLLVREALQEHHIECKLHVMADGEEAMTFIDQLDAQGSTPCPDLLLLDWHLPKRDGEEIMRHLRASERCAQTPVIILTASDSPNHRQVAERNAALHYFRKSASFDTFMEIGVLVKQVLEKKVP